jgi:Protein of unknown function (DUF3007)
MRRIDVIGIGLGALVAGGLVYVFFRGAGFDTVSAGIWSQVIFFGAMMGWVVTYLTRVLKGTMTYNQQVQDYEDAFLQQRLDAMSPEELAQLQAELDQEKQEQSL